MVKKIKTYEKYTEKIEIVCTLSLKLRSSDMQSCTVPPRKEETLQQLHWLL